MSEQGIRWVTSSSRVKVDHQQMLKPFGFKRYSVQPPLGQGQRMEMGSRGTRTLGPSLDSEQEWVNKCLVHLFSVCL